MSQGLRSRYVMALIAAGVAASCAQQPIAQSNLRSSASQNGGVSTELPPAVEITQQQYAFLTSLAPDSDPRTLSEVIDALSAAVAEDPVLRARVAEKMAQKLGLTSR